MKADREAREKAQQKFDEDVKKTRIEELKAKYAQKYSGMDAKIEDNLDDIKPTLSKEEVEKMRLEKKEREKEKLAE